MPPSVGVATGPAKAGPQQPPDPRDLNCTKVNPLTQMLALSYGEVFITAIGVVALSFAAFGK